MFIISNMMRMWKANDLRFFSLKLWFSLLFHIIWWNNESHGVLEIVLAESNSSLAVCVVCNQSNYDLLTDSKYFIIIISDIYVIIDLVKLHWRGFLVFIFKPRQDYYLTIHSFPSNFLWREETFQKWSSCVTLIHMKE